MAAQTDGERIDRLEKVVQILAEDQISLQKLIAELATETRRGFDRVQQQFEAIAKETDRRTRQTDERIDKLVSAIGEFIRKS